VYNRTSDIVVLTLLAIFGRSVTQIASVFRANAISTNRSIMRSRQTQSINCSSIIASVISCAVLYPHFCGS
jgi:hypothetical protein